MSPAEAGRKPRPVDTASPDAGDVRGFYCERAATQLTPRTDHSPTWRPPAGLGAQVQGQQQRPPLPVPACAQHGSAAALGGRVMQLGCQAGLSPPCLLPQEEAVLASGCVGDRGPQGAGARGTGSVRGHVGLPNVMTVFWGLTPTIRIVWLLVERLTPPRTGQT